MNRYTVIREEMSKGLQAKTGWGRNEILALLDQVLLAAAQQEIGYLTSDQRIDLSDAVIKPRGAADHVHYTLGTIGGASRHDGPVPSYSAHIHRGDPDDAPF